jgi:hypothetical protein
MHNRLTLAFAAAGAIVLLGFASPVQAQPYPGMMGGYGPGYGMMGPGYGPGYGRWAATDPAILWGQATDPDI